MRVGLVAVFVHPTRLSWKKGSGWDFSLGVDWETGLGHNGWPVITKCLYSMGVEGDTKVLTMKQNLFHYMSALLGGILVFIMSSCGDEPVMKTPVINDLVGVWECQGFSKREKNKVGNEMNPGNLILQSNRTYIAQKFPVSDPLRMIEKNGRWDLLDPSITPSGVCSVELDGNFLSLYRRGDKLVLRYPVDVLEGISVEYVKWVKREK